MKPGDFLLGVLDFFAILLPGAMATWLITRYVPPGELTRALSFGLGDAPAAPAAPDPVLVGTAFLLSSYMLGHFVFMAGSRLDTLYDRWRRRVKPRESDTTYLAAERLHRALTTEIFGGEFSTFKWAKAYIQVHSSPARVEIDRLEADSKFFRSLVVVSVAFTLHFLLHERAPAMGVAAVVMAVLANRRYREQRWKMTELSYGTAVIVHATAAVNRPPAVVPATAVAATAVGATAPTAE